MFPPVYDRSELCHTLSFYIKDLYGEAANNILVAQGERYAYNICQYFCKRAEKKKKTTKG